MKKILFYIFICMVLAACSNEDKENEKIADNIDISLLEGEWIAIVGSNNKVANISFSKGQRVRLSMIQDSIGRKSIYTDDEGSWAISENDNTLSFNFLKLNIPNQEIVVLSNDRLLLRNKNYNSIDTYHRVAKFIELDAGNEISIQDIVDNPHLEGSISLNPSIVSIDSDGKMKGHQGGTTFIALNLGQETIYVKVIVRSRIEMFANETQLFVDEIVRIHGEPDMIVYQVSEDVDAIIYHNNLPDSDLDFLGYYYNSYGQIATIESFYRSDETYDNDFSYIQSYYHKLKTNQGEMFGQSAFIHENSYFIIPTHVNDPVVTYINNKFYTEKWLTNLLNKDNIVEEEPKELYMEPYTVWNGSVDDVKTYMAGCEMAVDIQYDEGGDDYWMFYYGTDHNGYRMGYEYHFEAETQGLYKIYVSISSKNNYSVSDLQSHLKACGYRSAGYNKNLNRYSYYSPVIIDNMYSSVDVYMNNNGNPVAFYLRTIYN